MPFIGSWIGGAPGGVDVVDIDRRVVASMLNTTGCNVAVADASLGGIIERRDDQRVAAFIIVVWEWLIFSMVSPPSLFHPIDDDYF